MEGDGVQRHCTKDFPKPYRLTTTMPDDDYSQYKIRHARDRGATHCIKVNSKDFVVDNSFVVSYNPYLSVRHNAHINVEVVHSFHAVKYLHKYVTKGQDRIIFSVNQSGQEIATLNEVENFVNARYISESEALWKLYGFYIHQKSPAVQKLPCHLPDEQRVFFEEDEAANVAETGPPTTKLTAFFMTNQTDPSARNILYTDFPRYFTWNAKDKKWQRRKRGN